MPPLSLIAIGLCTLVLASCGQVMTLEPTATPAPTPTLNVDVVAANAPTSTPAPYTPAPTPTFTTTPTPIVHEVGSGENLQTIARLYNVNAATLQDANGILDPRALQVGQQLIVPPPSNEESDISNATPTPTPLPLQIENVHLGETRLGNVWVLGEVFNDSATPLEQVRVGAALLDESDSALDETSALVGLDLVDVGERAPFALLFDEALGNVAGYQVVAVSAVPAFVGSYYLDLTVDNVEIIGERYASYSVAGTVRNIGPENAVAVQVVITAYDALDRVVAARQIVPDVNTVPTGGEVRFRDALTPVGGPIVRVEARAQGRRAGTAP